MARLQNPTSKINNSDDIEVQVQARSLRALQDQLEALGVSRRERLSEDDFPDNRRATPRASALEATRRINLEGTTESRVSDNVKGLLSSWSNAWTALADDEAARENLTDINAGQTHRANLALRVSDQQFDVSADIPGVGYGDARYRGSDRARGGGRGGRGGGHAGSRRSRHGPTRVPVGLETIDEMVAPRATNGNITIPGARPRVSPSMNSQTTIERSLRGRSVGELMKAGARRSVTSLATRPRPDSELHAQSTAKAKQKPIGSPIIGTARRVPYNAFSLADPDTFMAMAGRKATTKTPSSKAASVRVSQNSAAKPARSIQGESSVSQDLIMLDPLDTGFRTSEKSTTPEPRKAIMPDLLPTANPQTDIDVMNPEDRATAQLQKKVSPPVQAADARKNVSGQAQQEVDHELETLRGLREFVPKEGGFFKAEIRSLIETLEARITSRLTAHSNPANPDETRVLADAPQLKAAEQRQIELPSPSSVTNDRAAPKQKGHTVSTEAKVTAAPSMGITAVKHKTVKIGLIFGENVYRDRYGIRSRAGSIASSVASTAEDIRSVSASFSQLSLQPRDSQRLTPPIQPAPITFIPAIATIDPKLTGERFTTSSLSRQTSPRDLGNAKPDQSSLGASSTQVRENTVTNDISTQSPFGDASGREPRYASSNPFARKQTPSESFPQSSGARFEQKDPFLRQHASTSTKRFNNAPYRRDEPFAPTDRPTLPDFLKELSSDGRDTGAAARRQYGGVSENIRSGTKKNSPSNPQNVPW